MIVDAYGKPYGATPEEQYEDAAAARRPHGAVVVDGKHLADTLCCPHCQAHFVVRKGSGVRRGFCTNCGGVTCGSPTCVPCRPSERQIDDRERFVRQHGFKP